MKYCAPQRDQNLRASGEHLLVKGMKLDIEEITAHLLRIAEYDEDVWQCDEREASELQFQDLGYVDSLSYIVFLTAVEDQFSLTFDFDEMESENFRTLRGIATLIRHKKL